MPAALSRQLGRVFGLMIPTIVCLGMIVFWMVEGPMAAYQCEHEYLPSLGADLGFRTGRIPVAFCGALQAAAFGRDARIVVTTAQYWPGSEPKPRELLVSTARREEIQASRNSQLSRRVSAKAVSEFRQWARERQMNEIVNVWRRAVEVFPRGWAIEDYPESVGDPSSKDSIRTRFMVSKQLENEKVKADDVEAVTLFKGGDGLLNRDVVLVVRKGQPRIVGVYQAWYGR